MRRLLAAAAALAALAACASGADRATTPSSDVTSTGTWAYAFDAGPGIASATLSGADGRPALRVTCTAPRGDLMVTDWLFSRARQGDAEATVTVGAVSKSVPGRIAGDGAGRQALTFALPPRDPMFAAMTPSSSVKTSAAGYTHTWAPGAATRLNDVINSCRTLGS
ncbi:MAG: hypothetical protein NW200_01275 [Hyphomonadaceae bacterium]|nr:hypothetical protein [Hyphomonadaceae bacterium]